MLKNPKSDEPLFSVCTPTFNRVDTIPRVYESLCAQTFKDFEWVVVDNGEDGTKELVEGYAQESEFPVRYVKQQSIGLHLAYNEGVDNSKGLLYFPLHSDDALPANSLELIAEAWNSIPPDQREGFCGVTGRCVDQFQRPIGFDLPRAVYDSDHRAIRYKLGAWYEMAGCYRTDVMKEFRFPDLGSTIRFVPEGWVWGRIASKYKTRFINSPVRIYTLPEEGKDSLMTIDPKKIALQLSLYHKYCLEEEISWFFHSPLSFLRSCVHYSRFSMHQGKGVFAQWRELSSWAGRILFLLGFPLGLFLLLRDRL